MRKLFAGDCLEILSSSDRIEDDSVDLIYLDPPFNSKSTYNLPFSKAMIKQQDLKPVMAFEDTWSWSDNAVEQLAKLRDGDFADKILASIVELVRNVYQEKTLRNSMGAYLINMAIRLKAMKRVLKPTGSIYIHCDPTASHYLKMLMDAIFGTKNFINECVWCYRKMPNRIRAFQRNHDIIFSYAKTPDYFFHRQRGEMAEGSKKTFESAQRRGYNANNAKKMVTVFDWDKYYSAVKAGIIPNDLSPTEFTGGKPPLRDWWDDIKILGGPTNKERLGYPTQKPLALLERIIRASSQEGGLVLDPFCGCGTTIHAANKLGRNWIGVDISKFSVGLVRNRVLQHFKELKASDLQVLGSVSTIQDALDLAKADKFEFEKWACGEIGATGMYHDPGERGSDGGVDGIIPFHYSKQLGENVDATYAIVQVKGGE